MKGMNILDVMLIILVIYIPNQLHFPADLGLRGMNVLNILLALTLLAMVATGAKAAAPAPLRWPIALFSLSLCVAFLVAQFRAPQDLAIDLMVLKSVLTSMLMYFIFYHSARDSARVRRLVAVILLVALVAAVEAVREGLDYGLANYSTGHRASGPFGHSFENANRAGIFYAMFLPMFIAQFLFRWRNGWVALAALFGAGVTVLAVFVTYSRQAYIIAAIGVLALAVKRNIVIGFMALVLLATWTYWAPEAAIERMGMTYVETQGGEEELEASARSRLEIWQGAARMIAEHPFGVGLNRFKDEIGAYVEHAGSDAHNSYVLTASEAGIPGALLLFVTFLGLSGTGLHAARSAQDAENRALALGYLASTLCMMLGNVYGSPLFSGEVMSNFWALSGLVAGHRAPRRDAVPSPTRVVSLGEKAAQRRSSSTVALSGQIGRPNDMARCPGTRPTS